eukprot:gnl/TRDRNA2_/TRDRNA2_89181_c1_seq1.p1 gnl/TRDRNA2_/TRDRNA2_89181_c1~~gnl/TRDRNA2_/TRDRNA2_89181_c1_seq1.p1  ORF type:complete len:636 (+),score=109.46 gnl/TRDRNA2_/TRDRNA2_89181_c1_seq1:265-1908(+)
MEGSGYDRLSPNNVEVPACFSLLEPTVTASMKKRCMFVIVDHLGRPFPRFPLKIAPRDSMQTTTTLRSKVDGKCSCRLGTGFFIASYNGAEQDPPQTDPQDWPVKALAQELEVLDSDIPQCFRISVQRIRFSCEIMLRTRFEEPVAHCPFSVRRSPSRGFPLYTGVTSEIGVAMCDLPVGCYTLKVDAPEESAFVQTAVEVEVREDGSFTPFKYKIATKVADVKIQLVTPDGEEAPGCQFAMEQQFPAEANIFMGKGRELQSCTDDSGTAPVTMSLLEPYIFRVKPTKAAEYMPQQFVFQTDKRSVTAVVARTVIGPIPEDKVIFVIDVSGSMHVYLDDVKMALNAALIQQFHKSKKKFNIIAYSERTHAFNSHLVDGSAEHIESALRFCEALEAGGSSQILKGLQRAFNSPAGADMEAIYLITDGKCDIKDEFLNQVRSQYFVHPLRPRINTVGINCVPRRLTWRGLQAVATLTQGVFRPVCLEQASIDSATGLLDHGGGEEFVSSELVGLSAGLDLVPAPAATTTDDDTGPEDAARYAYDSDHSV